MLQANGLTHVPRPLHRSPLSSTYTSRLSPEGRLLLLGPVCSSCHSVFPSMPTHCSAPQESPVRQPHSHPPGEGHLQEQTCPDPVLLSIYTKRELDSPLYQEGCSSHSSCNIYFQKLYEDQLVFKLSSPGSCSSSCRIGQNTTASLRPVSLLFFFLPKCPKH